MDRSFRRSLAGAITASIVLTGLLGYGVISALGEVGEARPAPEPAPVFTLDVLEPGTAPPAAVADGAVGLDELRGTPVVVNFWASWCEACREETPMVQRIWEQARRDGVQFVGVDTADLDDDARAFLAEHGVTYPTVIDADSAVADDYGVQSIPTTVFIDAEGQVVDKVIGVPSPDEFDAGIAAARRL